MYLPRGRSRKNKCVKYTQLDIIIVSMYYDKTNNEFDFKKVIMS
jgi:hypothetical protein